MGLFGIGDLLSCNRDGAFCEGYDPRIKLSTGPRRSSAAPAIATSAIAPSRRPGRLDPLGARPVTCFQAGRAVGSCNERQQNNPFAKIQIRVTSSIMENAIDGAWA